MIDGKKKRVRSNGAAMPAPIDGVRAARLRAIKSDILSNLRQHALSLHGLASQHQVSVVYVRQLFAAEGATFDEFVLQQRLAAAHAMLSDPQFFERTITAIAFEVGFGDVGRFNRAFRRRYRMKPSDMREAARN